MGPVLNDSTYAAKEDHDGKNRRRHESGGDPASRETVRVGRGEGGGAGLRVHRADGPLGPRADERGPLLPHRLDVGRPVPHPPGRGEGRPETNLGGTAIKSSP